MRSDKLIPGAILIILGVVFLLDNFGYINFSWWNIIHLWPILLVMAGVNIMFAHNNSAWATALKLVVVLIGMGLLLFGGFKNQGNNSFDWSYNRNHNRNNDWWNHLDDDSSHTSGITKIKGNGRYTESFKPKTQNAILNISGGATTYNLQETTNLLFDAATEEYGRGYSLKTNTDGNTQVVDFMMKDSRGGHQNFSFGDKSNHADIKLNTNPEWEINVQAGAAKLNFDLSKFKIKKLKVEGGAASFDVKMGEPLVRTDMEFSTGVSNVDLQIPQNAACHITTDTGLSSKTFDGFNKISDTEYETSGFANAAHKIYISMSGGVSSFKVNRY